MKWKTAVRKEELKEDVLTPEQKIEVIKSIVCEEYGQTWPHITHKGQKGKNSFKMANKSRVFAKQVLVYFIREFTKDYSPRTPLTDIAKLIQGEKRLHPAHNTILYTVNMIAGAQEFDKELRGKIQNLRVMIENEMQKKRNLINEGNELIPVHI